MGRKPLLKKEAVIGTIHNWLVQYGAPPTIEELRRTLKVGSTRTVLRYLQALEDEGLIERWAGARGLRLLRGNNKGLETVAIPLVGEAPAGPLMVAEENIEGWVRLPKSELKPSSAKFFLLRVRGTSMNKAVLNGERIESGDLVIVQQQQVADKGDIIVALIDGQATIKRLDRGPGYFILKPESTERENQPIVVRDEFTIAGIVRGILKKGTEFLLSEDQP